MNRDLETANRVRRTVAQTARLPSALTVEAAVSAVMCVLTERLTAGEATELLAGLPPALRPMFQTCVAHREGKPTSKIDRAEFLRRVADHLGVTPAHAELVSAAVFDAIRGELPDKVVAGVAHQLPRSIQGLWLSGPRFAPALDVTVPLDETRRAVEYDVETRASLPPGVTGEAAVSAVMCTFARRLSGGEARDVVLGLPSDVRALLETCVAHRGERADVFGRDELFRQVCVHLGLDPAEHFADGEAVARSVFRAVKRVLPQSTVADVASQLPADLLELWQGA